MRCEQAGKISKEVRMLMSAVVPSRGQMRKKCPECPQNHQLCPLFTDKAKLSLIALLLFLICDGILAQEFSVSGMDC